MLYLHHHPNQSNVVSQSTSNNIFTHSLIANNIEKYSIGPNANSNSFCGSKPGFSHNENMQPQHSSRATSSQHNMNY
jgi:hypothetical protein